jgi:hypothetical protein
MNSVHRFFFCLFVLLFTAINAIPALADGGTLFFTGIVEHAAGTNPQIALEWGALEGEIPAEITGFRLYRSVKGADHVLLTEISRSLADSVTINSWINSDLPARSLLLTDNLTQMNGGPADYSVFLHDLLDKQSSSYDSLRTMLLTRSHLTAARAQGLAFIDTDINITSNYQYLLTAITAGGETLPIGQTTTLDPATETILPAPTGLAQVFLSRCSPLEAGLDDNQIHFTWDISDAPQDMGLKIITYGYDLFWSATDQGIVDFRTDIPGELHHVTPEPVVAAGPPPQTGPDSYLARDGAENHTAPGQSWERGQLFYYYLAARDIFGHYSTPVSPVMMRVADAMPPHAVWNAHTLEIKDPADGITPRLALVWDAPTAVNFSRYFGDSRTYCSADANSICWAGPEESCSTGTRRCADLAVDQYRIFRFSSAAAAASWGIDSDGDGWPDNLENPESTCNPDLPAETPPEWIATISADDPAAVRSLSDTHQQFFFVDFVADNMLENNQVYWYRVIALDAQGNQSPVSPPLRGVLYDRSQPDVSATLSVQQCSYMTKFPGDCGDLQPETDDVYLLHDLTGDAASYQLLRLCGVNAGTGGIYGLLDSGTFDTGGVARITGDKLPSDNCVVTACNSFPPGYLVRFYDGEGVLLAETESLNLKDSCHFAGCITLDKSCEWVENPDPFAVADGSVRACVTLHENESARFYYQTPGGMSAFATIPPVGGYLRYCRVFDDLPGLTPADICLAVRVFNEHHMGSILHNLGCLELHDSRRQPPPTPILESPEPLRNTDGDFFSLHWSIPAAGISAYTLKISSEDNSAEYVNLWDIQADDSGRYPYDHPLTSEDLGRQWCFRIRAQATDMQVSDWSGEQCAVWQLTPPENLPWPPVEEPEAVVGESLGAFFMLTDYDHRPVLVLSDNLAGPVSDVACTAAVPYCDMHTYGTINDPGVSPCIRDNALTFYACPVCSLMQSAVIAQNFIIYRQESGRDFIQVSPLIEGFHCFTDFTDKTVPVDHLQDPFLTIMDVAREVVTGVSDPAGTGTGTRLLFKDRYPFRTGTSLRYKLVSINPKSGEPEKIYTSNWLTVP